MHHEAEKETRATAWDIELGRRKILKMFAEETVRVFQHCARSVMRKHVRLPCQPVVCSKPDKLTTTNDSVLAFSILHCRIPVGDPTTANRAGWDLLRDVLLPFQTLVR